MKEFLCGMGKGMDDSQIDDPLLRAMKKELSTRIFGSNSVKKEDFEDSHGYRNSGSPLANEATLSPAKESEADQWFSIIPKDSCDSQTLLLSGNNMLPPSVNLRMRTGLPPSPGPIPLCDSPAPLILSPEEAAMLEHLKTSGPRPPPVKKPVPKCEFVLTLSPKDSSSSNLM